MLFLNTHTHERDLKRIERDMPPEVSLCHPISTSFIQEPPTANQPSSNKIYQGEKKQMITKRKLIPLLVFLLSGLSIVRLLKISLISSFSSPFSTASLSTDLQACSSTACKKDGSQAKNPQEKELISSTLTRKEYQFLSNIISSKSPCNLLVFGLEPQYLNLASSFNRDGTTVILEDNTKNMRTIKRKHGNTRIYKVEYSTKAGDAYKLLKQAREDPDCALHSRSLQKSSCALALKKLPKQVYKRKWDVVVVDGPRGDTPADPGRMSVIYTAGMIARAGNMTDVVVHDSDRMIEKWFSWEFLCEENFISSKGKLWDFRIAGGSNSTRFCNSKTIQIV